MINPYKKNAAIGFGIYFAVFVIGLSMFLNYFVLSSAGDTSAWYSFQPYYKFIPWVIQGLLFWTTYNLAKAKGYTGWLCLLSFLNLLGLLILFVIPDKTKSHR